MDQRENPSISFFKELSIFILFWLGFMLLGFFVMGGLANMLGIQDMQHLFEEMKKGNYLDQINSVKILSGIVHLFSYAIPALAFVAYRHREKWRSYLHLNRPPRWANILLVVGILISAFPLISLIYYLNTELIPADWIAEDTLELQELLMGMNTPMDLILNLLVIGLFAGVGEELIFRGIIQRIFAARYQHFGAAIWITALIFSIIHFQPEGFVPRLLLGALFGYLLVWTGSLWVPILAHITFNGAQVLIQYIAIQSGMDIEVEEASYFPILPTIIFSIIALFLTFVLIRINRDRQLDEQSMTYEVVD